MTAEMWFGIVGSFMAVLCLILMFFSGAKVREREEVLFAERNNRQAKIDFMLRELGEIFKQSDFKKKTHLCGILEALEWAKGDRKDEAFIGWMLAKKQFHRKEKK